MKTNKRLFIFAFIILIGIGIDSNAAGWNHLKIELKFGVKGHSCSGSGICLIYIPEDRFPGEYTTIAIEKNLLFIDVPFSIAKGKEGIFNGELFIMEEEYSLPTEVCKELGIDYQLRIPSGKHQIRRMAEGYRIEISIQ